MSDTPYSPAQLAESLKAVQKAKGLPPVHDWNPDFCGDIDMEIKRDGSWHYMGSPISRESMVRLFSTILRKDSDGCTYLVTPVEKVRIQVEDAHFVVTQMRQEEEKIIFTTTVGDEITLDKGHPLLVSEDPETLEPSPYVKVRDNLNALIHRNVFYQLIEIAEEKNTSSGTELQIQSSGSYFTLGKI